MKTEVEQRCRQVLTDARRVIVKIGTRVITDATGRPEVRYLRHIVNQVAALHAAGHEVILVSSGAVGAGMEALGITSRPTAVPDLQMCAAVGQARLMATYQNLFAKKDIIVGQVLLTHADFAERIRLTNAGRALERLLRQRVVPIINENDVVADEELKKLLSLGDNDYLAALVTKLTHAHLLVLLSTVDGLLATDEKGRKTRVTCVADLKQALKLVNKDAHLGGISKGGMDSKLRAAQIAAEAGVPVVIASGRRKSVLERIVKGEDEGTLFATSPF